MKDEFGNECPYDFKNITYKGESITGYETFGLDANTYYPTFTTRSLISYFQWGTTYRVTRNSSLDTTIDGVNYYGYTCSSTPTAWSSADFYVIDAEISSSSTRYTVTDGTVSQISYGGSLSVNKSLEHSISGNVLWCKIASSASHQGNNSSGLNCNIFIGDQQGNILEEDCQSNTLDSGASNNIFEKGVGGCILKGTCSNNTLHVGSYDITLENARNYDSRITPLEEALDEKNPYSIGVTYYSDGTIGDLYNYLASKSLTGRTLLLCLQYGTFIGYVGDASEISFHFHRINTFEYYEGNAVSPDTSLWTIINTDTYKKSNRIAELEARIAALEGTTT